MTATAATGAELAESLLGDVGDECVQAATRLLGRYRDGWWLRTILDPHAECALHTGLTNGRWGKTLDWDRLARLLDAGLPHSSSELAVLEAATSLAGSRPVDLGRLVRRTGGYERKLITNAMAEAAG